MSFRALLVAYILGGLTFLPLLLVTILAFCHLSLPKHAQTDDPLPPAFNESDATAKAETGAEQTESNEKSKTQLDTSDAAAGYFAVCREYVPGGINGKPPERSSPAGEVLIAESPSVYQSMYRSIFERGKTQVPSLEGDKKDGKPIKRARNVFFVVLRHEHLLLFDSAEQLEVRHVVSLSHHRVDIYGGGEAILEGDLFVKRNCIRLTRRQALGDPSPSSQPFYLFSDNCSEKEDFYHALLRAQSNGLGADGPPQPILFETAHIIKLVEQLHASDTDKQARWLNALIGRIFLAMYKTQDIEQFIRVRIDRKISRIQKPTFIPSVALRKITLGDAAPIFSNLRLKELIVDGTTTFEADVKYTGGLKIEIAAVARLDLGPRIRAREVSILLLGTLRRLSGRILFKIKPPPSNRMWISFETMPLIDLNIEPVVSSRQITYGVILRAIESKIREVFGETLVQPNWDDIPFLNTEGREPRGGIWETSESISVMTEHDSPPQSDADMTDPSFDSHQEPSRRHSDAETILPLKEKIKSMPALPNSISHVGLSQRSLRRGAAKSSNAMSVSSSVSASPAGTSSPVASEPVSPLPDLAAEKPKPARSNSFAATTASAPLVSVDYSTSVPGLQAPRSHGQRDAVDLVKEVKSRSRSTAEVDVQFPDEEVPSDVSDPSGHATDPGNNSTTTDSIGVSNSASHSREALSAASLAASNKASRLTSPSVASLNNATQKAKNWGWNVLNRPTAGQHRPFGNGIMTHDRAQSGTSSSLTSGRGEMPLGGRTTKTPVITKEPMGRGQPLPPPGTPLPGPQKSLWAASGLGLGSTKRKPVAPPQLPPRRSDWAREATEHNPQSTDRGEGAVTTEVEEEDQPPRLPARPQLSAVEDGMHRSDLPGLAAEHAHDSEELDMDQASRSEDILVIAAPIEDHGTLVEPAGLAATIDAPRSEHPDTDFISNEQDPEINTKGTYETSFMGPGGVEKGQSSQGGLPLAANAVLADVPDTVSPSSDDHMQGK
ncbi:hypothetical protein MBLNU457_4172t1 [Dothideomycetes sp. NU457]